MERTCSLCTGRICVDLSSGRLVNDNKPDEPFDPSKVRVASLSIEDCGFREGMLMDDRDEKLLGS